MGLFQFLEKTGDVIGGSVGDFGAKSGELVGTGIKGLRTGKSQPLSFRPDQYVGSGLMAGAQAYGVANVGGALAKPALKTSIEPSLTVVERGFKIPAAQMAQDSAIAHFKSTLAQSKILQSEMKKLLGQFNVTVPKGMSIVDFISKTL